MADMSREMPACHTLPGDVIRRNSRDYDVLRVDISVERTVLWLRLTGSGNFTGMESVDVASNEILRRVASAF